MSIYRLSQADIYATTSVRMDAGVCVCVCVFSGYKGQCEPPLTLRFCFSHSHLDSTAGGQRTGTWLSLMT